MIKKKVLIIAGLALVAVMIAAVVLNRHQLTAFRSNAEAMGLRGTAKVSRPLSKTQVERLETHFLDLPSAPRFSSGSSLAAQTLNQVETINKLNARQSK